MVKVTFILTSIVTQKEIVWIHGCFHRIFRICQQWWGGHLLRGQTFQNVFEEFQASNGIEGILAFLDNNILIAIATAEWFKD